MRAHSRWPAKLVARSWIHPNGFRLRRSRRGGLVRASNGNYYRALHTSTGKDPTLDDHSNWELYYVRAGLTLKVATSGAQFSSLQRAWAMVSSATIAATAKVAISIVTTSANYSESFAAPFSLNAESGRQITISGDNAAKITLSFPSDTDGLTLTGGHVFGGISGLTISGPPAHGRIGISVSEGSTLLGGAVTVQNYIIGIEASEQSYAICDSCSIRSFDAEGILALAAKVRRKSATIDGGGISDSGIEADQGSNVDAEKCTISNCSFSGIKADAGTYIFAYQAKVNACRRGLAAYRSSMINGLSATLTNNTLYGVDAENGGRIDAQNTILSGNAADFNITPNTGAPDLSMIQH